jgi:putative spermidine/putrescine transport system permease protein
MRIKNFWAAFLLGVPVAFMTAFFIVPFLVVVVASFQTGQGEWSLANYARIFKDTYYSNVLYTTFKLSLMSTLVSFLIGYPIAYYIVNVLHSRLSRRICYILVIMPLFTSNIVRSFGWIILLGRQGLVNTTLVTLGIADRPMPLLFTELSIVIGLTYILVPFMVLTVASVLQTIDKSLVEAALDLGTSRIGTFLRVTFPLSLPGVVAGSLIVFTLAVSAYVVPSIMSGGRTVVMAMSIFEQYGALFDFNFGAALAVGLLVVTLLLIGLYLFFIERQQTGRQAVLS